MKRTILISLFAVFLAGCAGSRKFTEIDSGYRVDDDSVHLNYLENTAINSAIAGAASAALPASLGLGAFSAATGGIAIVAAATTPLITCPLTKCYGHEPYDDILMSGNVLRGEIVYVPLYGRDDPSLPKINPWHINAEYRIFKKPEKATSVAFPINSIDGKWGDYPLFEESLGLQGGDLVDVYYPHNPNLEREAIAKKLIYSGTIVRIVCKYDDDDCFDKYARNDDNFILGRWKTLEEYKAEYTTTGGFPNTETPTTATSE